MTEDETEPTGGEQAVASGPDDDAIRALVERLARRHPSGGTVIERAAILAEGADSAAVVAWIIAHDGKPEAAVVAPSRGLHGPRLSDPMGSQPRPPLRYVLPASVRSAT
jgi:hypothetical protein